MAERLPIIYVRGFAGGQSGIDTRTDDPFYGFNVGSTHARVGARGTPISYQSESSLLRLILDDDYALKVKGGQLAWLAAQGDGAVDGATIWIHRFYDVSASTFGEKPEKYSLERAAESLLELIELVRKTGAPPGPSGGALEADLSVPDPESDPGAAPGRRRRPRGAQGDRLRRPTVHLCHPARRHRVRHRPRAVREGARSVRGHGADTFGPALMWYHLNPGDPGQVPQDWDPREVPDAAFPRDRILTLIGTHPDDYDVSRGLSSRAAGARSDALVQIEGAYVPGARFTFVHRSHACRYGVVNSEEGYQNLRRFLLGDVGVTADLVGVRLPDSRRDDVIWQAEVELAVRGLPTLMPQQVAAHHCPVVLEPPADDTDRAQPLVTTFLIADPMVRPESDLERTPDVADTLAVDIDARDGALAAWATWKSDLAVPLRDHVPIGEQGAAGLAHPDRQV